MRERIENILRISSLDNKCLVACDPTPEGSCLMNMGGAQRRKAAEEVDKNVVTAVNLIVEFLVDKICDLMNCSVS